MFPKFTHQYKNLLQKIFAPVACPNKGLKSSAHRSTKLLKLHPYKIKTMHHFFPTNNKTSNYYCQVVLRTSSQWTS